MGALPDLLLILFLLALRNICKGEEVRGCYGETVEVECSRGQMINIVRDFFGHSASYSCLRQGDDPGCRLYIPGTRSAVKRICNGRQRCRTKITDKPRCDNGRSSNFQHIVYECISVKKTLDICTDLEWSASGGYLTTPGYPGYYPGGLDCACTLSSNGGQGWIGLTTFEFNIYQRKLCRDWIYVTADNKMEKFCGTTEKSYRAKQLSFVFHSERDAFKGFLLYFEALRSPGPVSVKCNRLSTKTPTEPSPARMADDHRMTRAKQGPTRGSDTYRQRTYETAAVGDYEDWDIQRGDPRARERQIVKTSRRKSQVTDLQAEDTHIIWPETSKKKVDKEKEQKTKLKQTNNVIKDGKFRRAHACYGEIINFDCEAGEVIRIEDEFYGDSQNSSCYHQEGDCILRPTNGMGVADQLCNSKDKCHNLIVSRMFCNQKVTNYQQVTYECVHKKHILDMSKEFTSEQVSGYLSTPHFQQIQPGKMEYSCSLAAIDGELELTIEHLMLSQDKECTEYLHVFTELTESKLCKAGKTSFTSRKMVVDFYADNKNGRSVAWLSFKGKGGAIVEIQCGGPDEYIYDDYPLIEEEPLADDELRPEEEQLARITFDELVREALSSEKPKFKDGNKRQPTNHQSTTSKPQEATYRPNRGRLPTSTLAPDNSWKRLAETPSPLERVFYPPNEPVKGERYKEKMSNGNSQERLLKLPVKSTVTPSPTDMLEKEKSGLLMAELPSNFGTWLASVEQQLAESVGMPPPTRKATAVNVSSRPKIVQDQNPLFTTNSSNWMHPTSYDRNENSQRKSNRQASDQTLTKETQAEMQFSSFGQDGTSELVAKSMEGKETVKSLPQARSGDFSVEYPNKSTEKSMVRQINTKVERPAQFNIGLLQMIEVTDEDRMVVSQSSREHVRQIEPSARSGHSGGNDLLMGDDNYENIQRTDAKNIQPSRKADFPSPPIEPMGAIEIQDVSQEGDGGTLDSIVNNGGSIAHFDTKSGITERKYPQSDRKSEQQPFIPPSTMSEPDFIPKEIMNWELKNPDYDQSDSNLHHSQQQVPISGEINPNSEEAAEMVTRDSFTSGLLPQTGNTIIQEQNINIGTLIETPIEIHDNTSPVLDDMEFISPGLPSGGTAAVSDYSSDFLNYKYVDSYREMPTDGRMDDESKFLYSSYLDDDEELEYVEYSSTSIQVTSLILLFWGTFVSMWWS